MSKYKLLTIFIRWAFFSCAFAYLLHGFDVSTFAKALGKFDLFFLLPLSSAIFLDYMAMAWRLKMLLSPSFNLRQSFFAVILCAGYNAILPAKAGDGIKIYWLNKRYPGGFEDILAKIIWERILDIAALLLASMLAWSVGIEGYGNAFVAPVLLASLTVLFILLRCISPVILTWYSRLPSKLGQRLKRIHTLLIDTPTISWLAPPALATVLIWLFYFIAFYIAICHLATLPLDIGQVLVVFLVTCLGAAIPSTPGSIGIFEGSMILALSWFDIEHNVALGLAVFLHAIYSLPVALLAIILSAMTQKTVMQNE